MRSGQVLTVLVLSLLFSSAVAFAPGGGGFGGGGEGPTNNSTHTPQWYSDQAEENNQEICLQSENHVVDKEGVCSCDEGWTGYPDCALLGPIDNCVSTRTGEVTQTTCVVLHPFTCEEELSLSWVLTLSRDEEPQEGEVSETKFSGLVSLDPKFEQQTVCAKSKVDLTTFSVDQTLDVQYCFYVSDVSMVGNEVFANVTYVYQELMARVTISESRIEFGMLSVEATACGASNYVALPCNFSPLPDTFAVSAGSSEDNEILVSANASCIYVKTARMVYPLCCARATMNTCQSQPTATAMCMEGLEIRVPLVEPQTGEDSVQESCGTIGELEVCLGVTEYRIDADKDSHRGASGVFQAAVTLPGGEKTTFPLGSFDNEFPMCGHTCGYEPGVSGWYALMWVILMNLITVGGFLFCVALAHFLYVQYKKSKAPAGAEEKDLAMVSLLDDSLEDGQELELVIEEEDDLLG